MAQGVINHICENTTKSLEAAKEREEEQLHHFAFCKEWLSSCVCRSAFAFPRVCLYFWKQQEHTGEGKQGWVSSQQTEPLLQFLLWHLSGQSLRGQWKPDQLAALKALTFLLHFRSVSW